VRHAIGGVLAVLVTAAVVIGLGLIADAAAAARDAHVSVPGGTARLLDLSGR
jgi:hypothetical protein